MNYSNIGNERVDIYKNIAESNKFVLFKHLNIQTKKHSIFQLQ